ncbi:MAG: ice-binding family protein, partial [Actinomycetota bacterium]
MTLSIFKRRPGARRFRSRATWATALSALFVLGMLVSLVGGAGAAPSPVPLGTADSFAVLAGSGITNTGPTTVNGDIGTFPTTTITGTATLTVTGINHGGDAVTQGAKTDLVTAYNNAAGQGPTSPIVADLGGQTLTPGVYNSASSIGLTGALTLNGGGNPNAVFVFQAGSTLTTASA